MKFRGTCRNTENTEEYETSKIKISLKEEGDKEGIKLKRRLEPRLQYVHLIIMCISEANIILYIN